MPLPDYAALADARIAEALHTTMQAFVARVDKAYAATRFAGTFRAEAAPGGFHAETLFSAESLFTVVEDATKPHWIIGHGTPAFLAFWWANKGVQFVGPRVAHPGTKGKQRVPPEFTQAGGDLGVALEKALATLV